MCKIIAQLTDAIGKENTDNLINMIERVRDRAIERHAEQDVTIAFNKAGGVQFLRASDNVNGVKPARYAPE